MGAIHSQTITPLHRWSPRTAHCAAPGRMIWQEIGMQRVQSLVHCLLLIAWRHHGSAKDKEEHHRAVACRLSGGRSRNAPASKLAPEYNVCNRLQHPPHHLSTSPPSPMATSPPGSRRSAAPHPRGRLASPPIAAAASPPLHATLPVNGQHSTVSRSTSVSPLPVPPANLALPAAMQPAALPPLVINPSLLSRQTSPRSGRSASAVQSRTHTDDDEPRTSGEDVTEEAQYVMGLHASFVFCQP